MSTKPNINFKLLSIPIALIVAIFFIKSYAIFSPYLLGTVELAIDEAQYIFWSTRLEWGYYSKPPFIAWILSPISTFCNQTEFHCYRTLQPVAFLLTSIVCIACTHQITGKFQPSIISGLLFFSLPISTFYSQFATTDSWLLFFWSLSLYFFILSLKSAKLVYFLLCGITIGMGLLTKYSMVFFCIPLLLFFFSQNKKISKSTYVLFLTVTLVFSPNILWNFSENFPTISHHIEMTTLERGVKFDIKSLFEFIIGQFVIFNPIVFSIFIISLFQSRTIHCSNYFFQKKVFPLSKINLSHLLLICFALPLLITVIFLSLIGETEINWASPISIVICIYIGVLVSLEKRKIRKKVFNTALTSALLLNFLFLSLFLNGPRLAKYFEIKYSTNINPFSQVEGYSQLANIIKKDFFFNQKGIISSNDRGILATLSIYLPTHRVRSIEKNKIHNHWDLKYKLTEAESIEKILVVLWVKNDYKTISNAVSRLQRRFNVVSVISSKNIDNLTIGGRKDKKLVIAWVNQ